MSEIELAYRDAVALADALWRAHYREQSPNWKPFPHLRGVISQIDNMTAGMSSSQSERVSRLEEAVEEAVIALVECAAILRGKGFPALAGIIDNYIERARSALNQGADDGR